MAPINRRDVIKLFTLAGAALGLLATPSKKDALLTTQYRLGKNPAKHLAKLNLRDYITPLRLPTPPENFGHETLVKDWGILGNDNAGDCAIAGPFHAEMLWCAEGHKPADINTDCALAAYSAITGYDPNAYDPFTETNPTDQGSDVHAVSEYWRTTGLTDASGNVHKIEAYLALEPKNIEELYYALYLFDGVGIGIECPEEYQESFAAGQVWDSLSNPNIEGGHYILGVGSRSHLINVVTWGKTQLMTAAGYEQFNDETYVYLNFEKLFHGKDVNGFNRHQLIADLRDLGNDSLSFPLDEPDDCPTTPLSFAA